MDELASHPRGAHPDDLAALVLGSAAGRPGRRDASTGAAARVRAVVGPERVPVDARLRAERGHDARSVAVLALVVAVLAALGGWLTSTGADPAEPTPAPSGAGDRVPREAAGPAVPAATSDAPPEVHGVDLALGRVVASRTDAGSGTVSVGVTNAGVQAYHGRAGANVLLLLDGDVVANEQLPPIEPGAATRIAVSLGWCPTGSRPVTALLDAGAAVREGDERNNATTRSLDFGC